MMSRPTFMTKHTPAQRPLSWLSALAPQLMLALMGGPMLTAALSGCLPTCDGLPPARNASVRAINAVTNTSELDVYIDGKLFDRALYQIENYTNPPFGYRNTFISDGSALVAGVHQLTVVRPGTTPDTLLTESRTLVDQRQSLLYMGRYHGTSAQRTKVLYLLDQVRARDTGKTLARFVDAVSDLDTIDTYFSKYAKVSGGALAPDLRIGYGQISDSAGSNTGTGRSPHDYMLVPRSTDGLRVTIKGDTSGSGSILTIPYWFQGSGFLATIITRGESKPIGQEATVSTIVLEDGEQGYGNYTFNNQSYGVRLVNATRWDSVSLLVKGLRDGGIRTDVPSQSVVLNVHRQIITGYWPLTVLYHGIADFYLSQIPNMSTVLPAAHVRDTSGANARYLFVAMDTAANGAPMTDAKLLIVPDTLTVPADNAFGRVRFVDACPDHAVSFTIDGKPITMHQGDVTILDVHRMSYTVPIQDGTGSSSFTIDAASWDPGYPVTVVLMASHGTVGTPFGVVYR